MRLGGTHGDDPDIIASITIDDHKQATRSAHPECDETLLNALNANSRSRGSDSSSMIVIAYGSSNTGIASGMRTPCRRKLIPALLCWSYSNPITYCMHILCIHQISRTAEPGMQAVT
jgi:hypothetical protein